MEHNHIQKCLKVSKIMQNITKSVQNYSKYHSKIFAGNYDNFAGNFRQCRQIARKSHVYLQLTCLPTTHMQKNNVENHLIKNCYPHHCASSGNFFVQIGPFFKPQRCLEECLKITRLPSLQENVTETKFSRVFKWPCP